MTLEDRVACLEGLLAAGLALQPGDYPVELVYCVGTSDEITRSVTLRILPWNTEPDTWMCPLCREERVGGQCECGYVRADVNAT